MKGKFELQEHYGKKVCTHVLMDFLRRDECLCLNCAMIEGCPAAGMFYGLCKDFNMALMVTRCANFVMMAPGISDEDKS